VGQRYGSVASVRRWCVIWWEEPGCSPQEV
jgi:hypothetical protein